MKFNLVGEIVAKNSRYTVTEKFVVAKKLSNTLFMFMSKVLIVTEILHPQAELLLMQSEEEVFVAEIDYSTIHYLARKNYITNEQAYGLCKRYGFDSSSIWKVGLSEEQVEAIEGYKYLVDEIKPEMVVITDEREDARQFHLKVGCGHYVYFEHEFQSGTIHSDEIAFSELTDDDFEDARSTFNFEDPSYTEEQKQMLAIELYFENNLY